MNETTVTLQTPEPELKGLSFCECSVPALNHWVSELPMANTAEAARQLHKASNELARLDQPYSQRLELLEALRPTVQYICARLDRTSMGPSERNGLMRDVTQRLQSNLVLGYKTIVRDSLDDEDTVVTAIHRAISDQTRVLLRAYQHYAPVPDGLWRETHRLFRLAEQLGVTAFSAEDSENHGVAPLSIQDIYLRGVLLGVARPNQLREQHLTAVFNALEAWTPLVSITADRSDALFVVDLESDEGARYAELVDDEGNLRGIRTDVLVYELEAYLNEIATNINIPDFIDTEQLRHVVLAWDVLKKRSFRRAEASGQMMVCVGIRAVHYYLSGGVEFADQTSSADALLRREINPFMADAPAKSDDRPTDVWDEAIDLKGRIPENPNIENPERILSQARTQEPKTAPTALGYFETTIVNTSPGGYCVRWDGGLPGSLAVGDLLAIREKNDQRWCIAVCRWIQHHEDGLLTGIELLAPRAIPVAIRVVRTKGGRHDFARGLLLPELLPINQPAMLITPKIPFQESHKVHISRQGIQTTAQLMRGVLSTESFNQFTFRMLDGYLENNQIDMNMDQLRGLIDDEDKPRPS